MLTVSATMTRTRRTRVTQAGWLVATMVAVLGCSNETESPPDVGQTIPAESPTGRDAPADSDDAPTSSDEAPAGSDRTTSERADASEPLGQPTAFEFRGVRAPVVSVGADEAAALEIPGDLDTLGWWKDGAEPGAAEGFVVITGHATQDGTATANMWWSAEPGERIEVETDRGTMTYRVTSRTTYPSDEIPLARWFPADGPNGPNGLALITCAEYTDGEWRSTLVVEAVPE